MSRRRRAAFYTLASPRAAQAAAGAFLASSATLFAPSVVPDQAVAGATLASGAVLFAPALQGSTVLEAPFLASGATLAAPSLAPVVALQLPTIASSAVVRVPTAAAAVALPTIASSAVLTGPAVLSGAFVTGATIPSGASLAAPALEQELPPDPTDPPDVRALKDRVQRVLTPLGLRVWGVRLAVGQIGAGAVRSVEVPVPYTPVRSAVVIAGAEELAAGVVLRNAWVATPNVVTLAYVNTGVAATFQGAHALSFLVIPPRGA